MKYIVDIPNSFVDITNGLHIPIDKEGNFRIDTGLKLIPYIEPDRKAIEDEVWELARRIICPSDCCEDSISAHTKEIFNKEGWEIRGIFNDLSYQEAKSKYEAWKKEKEEIRVGDEVKHRGLNYVVGYVGADKVYHLIDKNWLRTVVQGGYQLIKTGRHFPEVAELLEKMR